MEALEYRSGSTILRVDDATLEVFARLVSGSLRVPLAWAAADLAPTRKGDQLQVRVGRSSDDGGPFYDPKLISEGAFTFSIPTSEEANLRAVLDEAARRGGRA